LTRLDSWWRSTISLAI